MSVKSQLFKIISVITSLLLIPVNVDLLRGGETETLIPRPEHPKPQFQRGDWLNLNGQWNFAFDFDLSGIEKGWPGSARASKTWISYTAVL